MQTDPLIRGAAQNNNERPAASVTDTRREQQIRRDLRDLVILSWALCLFAVCLLLVSERQNAERDFVYFYSAGRIANEYSPEQIYNFDVQRRAFEEVRRLKGHWSYGPSPYPPFIPLLFSVFAHLPFARAYDVWQFCTLALFCGGIGLLARGVWGKRPFAHSLLAACLSFYPFTIDTLATGQIAAIGCFAFSLALYQQGKGCQFRSGLALSLALYKPTLLLLVLPMLVVRKQWRTLAGVIVGAASLFAVVTAFMGVRVWAAYLSMVLSLRHLQAQLDFSRYVDVFAFSTLLAHNHSLIKNLILVGAFAVGGSFLVRVWIRSRDNRIIWATTITWTLFLNLYVPIYDSILVIPGIIVSARALIAYHRRSFTAAALLLFCCSWVAEPIARATGIQALSIALVLLGALQLRVLGVASRSTPDFRLNRAGGPSVDSSSYLPAQLHCGR
jgi:hypothetical protein